MRSVTIFQPDGIVVRYTEGQQIEGLGRVQTILDRSDDYPVVRIFTESTVVIYKGISFIISEERHDERGPRS